MFSCCVRQEKYILGLGNWQHHQSSNIRPTKSPNFNVSRFVFSCLGAIYWSQVLSSERRCRWSSANRRCSNYIWVIRKFITYYDAPYIGGLTVSHYLFRKWLGTEQVASHYLSQCRTRSMLIYDITRPQWIKDDHFLLGKPLTFLLSWNLVMFQPFTRSGTHKWNLWLPNLQMSCCVTWLKDRAPG